MMKGVFYCYLLKFGIFCRFFSKVDCFFEETQLQRMPPGHYKLELKYKDYVYQVYKSPEAVCVFFSLNYAFEILDPIKRFERKIQDDVEMLIFKPDGYMRPKKVLIYPANQEALLQDYFVLPTINHDPYIFFQKTSF